MRQSETKQSIVFFSLVAKVALTSMNVKITHASTANARIAKEASFADVIDFWFSMKQEGDVYLVSSSRSHFYPLMTHF